MTHTVKFGKTIRGKGHQIGNSETSKDTSLCPIYLGYKEVGVILTDHNGDESLYTVFFTPKEQPKFDSLFNLGEFFSLAEAREFARNTFCSRNELEKAVFRELRGDFNLLMKEASYYSY